jgi:cytosolic carboxypeptidase protein 2/3
VITGRVRPGEPQSSYFCEGLINYLLSDEDEAKEIRSKFIVKIIPMLNPDGVILGNTRASLLGCDLNRRWQKPSKFLHPTIYYTKSMLKYLNKKMQEPDCKAGGVVTYVDVHGHHKHKDMFMYGCAVEGAFSFYEGNKVIMAVPDAVDRILPVFNTQKCRFAVEPDKLETGRLVVFK